MNTIDPAMTLGGGTETPAVACANQALDPVATSSELAAVVTEGEVSDWSTMSAAELVDHLEATHRRQDRVGPG